MGPQSTDCKSRTKQAETCGVSAMRRPSSPSAGMSRVDFGHGIDWRCDGEHNSVEWSVSWPKSNEWMQRRLIKFDSFDSRHVLRPAIPTWQLHGARNARAR